MTTPLPPGLQPGTPPVDTGNALLAEVPAQLACALVDTPGGQRLALTIRTPSCTQTVFLRHGDGQEWGRAILAAVTRMSRSGLVVANGALNGGAHG